MKRNFIFCSTKHIDFVNIDFTIYCLTPHLIIIKNTSKVIFVKTSSHGNLCHQKEIIRQLSFSCFSDRFSWLEVWFWLYLPKAFRSFCEHKHEKEWEPKVFHLCNHDFKSLVVSLSTLCCPSSSKSTFAASFEESIVSVFHSSRLD